jgi:phage I-like protein
MNTETNTKLIVLNPTQTAVLTHAIDHTQGKIKWFPENIKGGARQKVIEGLFKRAMIIGSDGDWQVTAEACDALGRERPGQRATAETATPTGEKTPKVARKTERKAAKPTPDAAASGDGETPAPRTRENSKQAKVIAMLKRPEGATIKQVCEATEWQAHTVRGTFAGAFKKKLGLTITSDKTEGGERIYRIAEAAPAN